MTSLWQLAGLVFALKVDVGVRCGEGNAGGDGKGDSSLRNWFVICGDGDTLASEWG